MLLDELEGEEGAGGFEGRVRMGSDYIIVAGPQNLLVP